MVYYKRSFHLHVCPFTVFEWMVPGFTPDCDGSAVGGFFLSKDIERHTRHTNIKIKV